MARTDSGARKKILNAALRQFAECGFAGASVQQIADDAQMTKPVLYYHFGNKAGLFHALIDWAHDERLRLMHSAAERGADLPTRLVEILAATFEFVRRNRALTRLAFSTAFAARGEVPEEANCIERGKRHYDYIHNLVREGLQERTLDRSFDSEALAMGVYGMMNFHVMVHLVMPEHTLTRRKAEQIVRLFLQGAEAPRGSKN